MFGRGKTQKSENDKYVMAMGKKAGNLKGPTPMKPKQMMKHSPGKGYK